MPEVTPSYVRLPVSGEAGKHEGHKIRTKTLSKKEGIRALYCIDDKKLITYLFIKGAPYNWTMSRAKAWVKSHKKAMFIELGEDGKTAFYEFDAKGDLTEQYGVEKMEEQLPKEPQPDVFTEERMIFLFGGVHEGSAESVCKKLLLYDRLDSKTPIKLVISSYGGSVYSSFAIIDMMEHTKAPVHTMGLGMVLSGGLLVFMAGDERYISQGASILSHRFSTIKIGSQAELKADEKEDRLVHQRMLDHYKKFSSLNTDEEVEAQLLKETNVWLSPEEAIGFDLADDFFDNWSTKESIEDENSIEEGVEIIEQILESIEVDSIEEQSGKGPFIFSGTVLKGDTESLNKRFYPMNVVKKAVEEVVDDPGRIKIMVGHPKPGDSSPLPIVGKFTHIEMREDGLVPFRAQLSNTRMGKDAQESLRSGLWEDLSIRAEGAMKVHVLKEENRKRFDVIDLHFKGLDFVIAGGIKDSKVGNILSEQLHDGGEENMSKKELLELEGVQELIADAEGKVRAGLEKEVEEEQEKIKVVETKLAEAKLRADTAEKAISDVKIKEYKEKKIEELDEPIEKKKLLRERVSGDKEEAIDKAITEELAYIKKIAPLFKETKVTGIKPKEETENELSEKEKDEEILREGHPKNFDYVAGLTKSGKL